MESYQNKDKEKKEILAEKSVFKLTLIYIVSAFAIILLLITGFSVKGFWDVVKYILFFSCIPLIVYYKFLLPKNAVLYDKNGIYINKAFNRCQFIEYGQLSAAEYTLYKSHGDDSSLYNDIKEVGTLKIFIKKEGCCSVKCVPFILNVPSTASILNILIDRYGKK